MYIIDWLYFPELNATSKEDWQDLCNNMLNAMHSTETTVLKVLSDILLALDSANLVMLTVLDLHTICDFVRNTARISSRANSIPSVHCRPTAACETPPADSSCICWWHSDLRVLSTCRFCQGHRGTCVDEVSVWMASNRLQLNHA